MYKKGILLSFITAIISGFSVFANSMFVTKSDPLVFALVRNVVVVGILSIILWKTRSLRSLREIRRKDWGKLLLIGAIGGGIPFALFFTGLSQVGAVNGNVINKTLFIWVALLAVPILHEKLTKLQLVGYAAILLSAFVIGGNMSITFSGGTFLVLLATLMWSVEYVIAKVVLRSLDFHIVAWGRMTFGLPFLLVATILTGKTNLLTQPSTYVITPLVVSSIFLVGYVMTWYRALSKAPATLVTSILVLAPVVTAILNSMFLHKPVAAAQLTSYVVLFAGVFLASAMKQWLPQGKKRFDHDG